MLTRATHPVDIFYIHQPDHSIPISETLAGINELHQAGHFKRFGLSNYLAADVQAVYDHCKEHSYVLPTVYQGNYNPVARGSEKSLFPTLRKLSIAFYAYSPLAGGFLAKTVEDVEAGKGRFDPETPAGKRNRARYANPTFYAALTAWGEVAKTQGCSQSNLAYRWVTFNSPLKKEYGDAIIIGASSEKQAVETLEGIKEGPLDAEVSERIDDIWTKIEKVG
jgi:aryl-alcohol dehydrogenase-like predicted oxidoreductase